MIIQQRVMTARFAEKARKNPEFVKQLGIEIVYEKKELSKGEEKNEKNNYYGTIKSDRSNDVEGDNI